MKVYATGITDDVIARGWDTNLIEAAAQLQEMLSAAGEDLPITGMEIFPIGEPWQPTEIANVGYRIHIKDPFLGGENGILELTGPINTARVQVPLGAIMSEIRADEPANLMAAELMGAIRDHLNAIQGRANTLATLVWDLFQNRPRHANA